MFQQFFPVVSAGFEICLNFRIGEYRQRCFTKLDIFVTGIVERGKLVDIGLDDIVLEKVEIVIDDLDDISGATEEMQHGGAGQDHLDGLAGQLFNKGEVFVVDRPGPVHARCNADTGGTDGLTAGIGIVPALFGISVEFEAADFFEKMGKISSPAEFTVGDDLKAHIFLESDDIPDCEVFQFVQFFRIDIASLPVEEAGVDQFLLS